ncbi:hypothetical protein [Aliivibrio fischeri]|uniref:hypothetical protein n=1 Tax=Aliivibrio fischeri TaxID=668 RepID=UPI00196A5A2F|nr:hypothetical protein [Aliivibrio fischeri]
MPIEKGFIKCSVCESDATVFEAEGKRTGKLYVVCPECGTDQSNKATRQAYIIKNMVSTKEELKIQPVEEITEVIPDTQNIVSEVEIDTISNDIKVVSGEVETKQEIADKDQSNSFIKSLGFGLAIGVAIITGMKVSRVLR